MIQWNEDRTGSGAGSIRMESHSNRKAVLCESLVGFASMSPMDEYGMAIA